MKKLIGIILGLITIMILAAIGICIPTYKLMKDMEENRSFTLEYSLTEDDSDLYRIAQILGVTDGRIEGYGTGNELWQFTLYGTDSDRSYAEIYIEKPEAEYCYVNVSVLGNYVKTVIGEQLPILKGVLKESDEELYLSLGQLEEITGLGFDINKLGEGQKKIKQAMKLLPLVNLLPAAYKENGYRYFLKDELAENLSIGIPGFGTGGSSGINVKLTGEFAGSQARADLWICPAEARELDLPGQEDFISDDEVRIIREFWELCIDFLLR